MADEAAYGTESWGPVERCDLLLRAGHVLDGTGAPGRVADVCVTGDRIVGSGAHPATVAEQVIDASGHVVAPGFIDVHTHDDRALLSAPAMEAKVSQGVTTVVTGNCGVSLAPLTPDGEMPMTFDLLGGREWFRFSNFADYRAELEQHPAAVNAVALVGHSTLRYGAMPTLERGAAEDEIATRQQRLAEAMRSGALGLSSGLYYPASRAAPTEEVIALAKIAAAHGGIYATHMRNEADGVEDSVEETLLIGREASLPVIISHHKVIGPQNFGRSVRTLARIERALKDQRVTLDLYPYIAGSTVLDPKRCDGRMRVMVTWSKTHPDMAGRDIDAIAAEWGCDPVEAAECLLPARTLGLRDRGELRTGAFADIAMFDPKRVIDRASFDHPKEPSEGIRLVMVNGLIVWHDGRAGGTRPGRVLHRSALAGGLVG